MLDITTIGEILIDLTQTGINENGTPQFAANAGGAPANVAVAAARLGASTAFIGKVGQDSFGNYLRDTLKKTGVNVTGLVTEKSKNIHTTLAVVSVDAKGERSFVFYRDPGADTRLAEDEVSMSLLKSTRFLHFGSVSLTNEPARSSTLFAAATARHQGSLVTYDPNYRANLWESTTEAVNWMKHALPLCDILKVSDEELLLLTDTTQLEKGTAQLCEAGPKLVLVTLGEKGCFYRFGSHTGHVAGRTVRVADTNGAGDTFFGALLSRLANIPDFTLESLTEDTLREALKFANTAASITTSRSGAIPAMPTLAEVERRL